MNDDPSNTKGMVFVQIYPLLLSLALFFAFIKLVNFFEAQMVIPPIFGIQKIRIVIFDVHIDSQILFITTITLLIIGGRHIKTPGITFRITVLASLISLIGIASLILELDAAIQMLIELAASFLILMIILTLALAPHAGSIRTTLLPSMVSYVSIIVISIQLVGLCHWLKKPWGSVEPMSHGALVDYQLFMTPLFATSFLLTALIFSWLWIPIARKTWAKYIPTSPGNRLPMPRTEVKKERQGGNRRWYTGVFILLAIVSLLVGYYPYMGVDKEFLVGPDSDSYYKWLGLIEEKGLLYLVGSGRELHVMFLGILHFFAPKFQALRISLSFNALFLFLATFLLMKREDDQRILLTAILSIFSVANVIGGTVGLLSNWFSLSLWYLTVFLLLRCIEGRSTALFIGANLASAAAMLSHSWTWEVLMGIIFIYGAYSFLIKKTSPYELKTIFVFLGLNGVFRLIYFYFRPRNQAWIVSTSRQLAGGLIQPFAIFSYFPKVWGLTSLSSEYSNFLIPILGVVGMATIIKRRNALDRMLTAWFFVCSLGVYASQIRGEVMWMPDSHAWRFLYLIPYHIPAAQGLITLLDGINRLFLSHEKEVRWILIRYGVMIFMAPFFSLLGSLSLLIIPAGLAATFAQLHYRGGTPVEDALTLTILALVNYSLRALTTGMIISVP